MKTITLLEGIVFNSFNSFNFFNSPKTTSLTSKKYPPPYLL